MTAESLPAISVSGITKRYGGLTAVDNVSFDVAAGEIFGFLGPNGAGKTTLIRMLNTLIRPTGGSAVVACCDVTKNPASVRREIGVVPQALTSDLDLTGFENMDIYGRFYSMAAAERRERIAYLLDVVGLTGRQHDLVASYSGGMRRRLEIARGLVHRPRILFLDEPTIGLDPQSRRAIWAFIEKLMGEDEMTFFLTTHYMEEAEALCDRVGIIDSGKLIALGTPDELKAMLPGSDVVSLTVSGPPEKIGSTVQDLPFVRSLTIEEGRLRIGVESGAVNLPGLLDTVRQAGGTVLSATVHEQSLEDVFIHFTGKTMRDEEAKKVSFFVGAGVPSKWGR